VANLLTRDQRCALVTRADLVASEAELVSSQHLTWAGRLAQLAGYGRSGGSALDRRLIVEAFAALEDDRG
jgi:hypothetical protein